MFFSSWTLRIKYLIIVGMNDIFVDEYDKLLIAPGSSAIKPPIEGIESNKIFYLKNVEDTYKIEDYIKNNRVKEVTVVGGGFIGVEVAENFIHKGLKVNLVEKANQVLTFLDEDMANFAHFKLKQYGINLILGDGVKSFSENGAKITLNTEKGCKIQSDLIILSLGVRPTTDFLKDSGIKLNARGYIEVDENLKTNIDDVYAVGDAVTILHSKTNKITTISLAGPANKQARIAADNIVGNRVSEYKGSNATSIVRVFDFAFASTGINERVAIAEGINYEKVIISALSHASYYPGAKGLVLKVIFDKDSLKILGGQILGADGVDKRIDSLSTLIYKDGSILDLTDIDFAYAPPFGSAKDPLNMVGYVADNLINGTLKQFDNSGIDELIINHTKYNLIDLRTPKEFVQGSIPLFKNIPLDELRDRLSEIDFTKPIYVICQSGLRSYLGSRILREYSEDVYNYIGGYSYYSITNLL